MYRSQTGIDFGRIFLGKVLFTDLAVIDLLFGDSL
jgi:hypothetical protein